ncbi:bifunctional glutamate N-acetyltransferase/amino-acid acetyltransferase ArgJ [Albirhodobacter sp. R86504]|uniref:bifunctional glutamate N-acetyltransferase/amino-acid acetyltransferase ArgJ n=1 Tax=Albirhodobacter sp. R86504 TaxID=3093848 RepID=UPI00366E674E
MGIKKWKAKAKELKAEIKALKKRGKAYKAAGKNAQAPASVAPVKKASLVSPLAPKSFPTLPVIDGVEFASAQAGIKYQGRSDVTLIKIAGGSAIAGVFTTSSTRAACVHDCQAKLKSTADTDEGAAIIVNSGNANAFTGAVGQELVDAVTQAVAAAVGVPASRVFSSSTGVIGEPLPHGKIVAKVEELAGSLDVNGIEAAANAIMTTDTFAKGATAEVEGEGGVIRIAGIAKGSGMIAPNMATMLVYIFTDAKISQKTLQRLLSRQVDETFNAITVDSDTSTSDALLIAATGRSEAEEISDLRSKVAKDFEAALRAVMMDLAHQVVKDGEGATKFVEVRVTGAETAQDAHTIAMSIANSPLVKTAIAGEDANWGRVVAAVGKSGAKAERDLLTISFGEMVLAEKGWRSPDYDEAAASAYMKGEELVITVDLGLGDAAKSVWTCDLTHRYIDINADYRS